MPLPVLIAPKPELEVSHHRIHEGNHFSVDRISKNIDPLFPKYFLIITPPAAPIPSDTIVIHMIFSVSANDVVDVTFFEDSIVSANGIPLFIKNGNRNSTTPSLTQISEGPAVVLEGTKIFEGLSIAGQTIGELDRDEDEIVLKIGSNYLLKITPSTPGPSTNATIDFDWYDQRPSSPIPII